MDNHPSGYYPPIQPLPLCDNYPWGQFPVLLGQLPQGQLPYGTVTGHNLYCKMGGSCPMWVIVLRVEYPKGVLVLEGNWQRGSCPRG